MENGPSGRTTPSTERTPKLVLLEESLDPDHWDAAREVVHRAVDDIFSTMAGLREAKAWKPVPEAVKEAIRQPLPREGEALDLVYEEFKRNILPYPTGNIHPRFWGWVLTNGSVESWLADFLCSAMNCHVAGYDQAAFYIEQQVIEWMRELMSFPPGASGLLVSGGTMANVIGLAVARNARAGFDVKIEGMQAPGAPKLRIYGSSETHNWIYKACELMGLGRQAFRRIDVDSDWRISIAKAREAIVDDIQRGIRPFCIVGTAGTVNTGAIDDLGELRELADEFGLWLHIDGAFGSLVALSDARGLVKGQEKADSLAFDLQKWGYMSYEIGAVLVRDGEAHRAAFTPPRSAGPAYLSSASRGIAVETTYFADLGIQLSRDFKALKAWMALKSHGVGRIGRIIGQNIDQIRYLGELVEAEERLELLAPISLNVACFRYVAPGLSPEKLDQLNQDIVVEVQLSGVAVTSHTWLNGRYAIRVCNTNHRSRREDFDVLIAEILRIGAELAAAR